MPVADAPEDDDVRQTYNFAPGNHGLVYRADVPDYGAGGRLHDNDQGPEDSTHGEEVASTETEDPKETRYKLQSMKWGLVPFWTKRNPDYGSVLKTINARDDSLANSGGMWNTMKQRKRCIVVAQGFYEWLKKNGGKEKIPHFVKRKDEQLMCFAGLWDCVRYEGSDEKHYTYTIITTDSNKQLSFLHDRMPVILENGSGQVRTWLDPGRAEWSKELQSLLKPFQGELDCYPVSKDVGKVGNNSPTFIVPVASTENKQNIANFFSNAKKSAKGAEEKEKVKREEAEIEEKGLDVDQDTEEKRMTMEQSSTEDNAPVPVAPTRLPKKGLKREHEADDDAAFPVKSFKTEAKSPVKSFEKQARSATSNGTVKGSPAKSKDGGSQKITNFFNY
jgi:putative SOS response-associated peptidase YedK